MANDEPPGRQPGYRPPVNNFTPGQEQAQAAASRISVDVSPRNVRVQPGEVVTASMKVRNMGAVVDEITLTPRGGAGSWITVAPDTLNIFPNTEAEATLRFAPARASRPPAGLFAYEVAVNSDRQPDSSMIYRGSVDLGSYDNLTAAATGTTFLTSRRESILPIKVRNLGNRPTNVQVTAADLPGATVSLSAPAFALEPGGEATVWATIRASSGFMSGPPRQHPFTVSVSGDYSAPLTIDGRMEQTARFGRRSMTSVLLAAATVAIVGGAVAANAAGLIHFGATASTASPGQTSTIAPSLGPTVGPTVSQPATVIPTDTGVTQPTPPPTAPSTDQGGHDTSPPTAGPPTASPSPTPNPFAGWESLGGKFSSGPAITSSGPGQLDVFGPWSDQTIRRSTWDGSTWSPWAPQPPQFQTQFKPTAVSWAPNHTDLFANLIDDWAPDGGNVAQLTIDPNVAPSWTPITPGVLTSGPAVVSWGPGRLDIFGRGTDTLLYHNWTDDGVNWNFWEALVGGLSIEEAPAAVAWGPAVTGGYNQLDVFARQSDGQIVWVRYTDNGNDPNFGWSVRGVVGGSTGDFTLGPAATSWGPNEFDVFGRWSDGTLRHSTWNGVNWSRWEQLTTFKLGTSPAAVAWGNGRIDVVVNDTKKAMHHSWLENGVWNPIP